MPTGSPASRGLSWIAWKGGVTEPLHFTDLSLPGEILLPLLLNRSTCLKSVYCHPGGCPPWPCWPSPRPTLTTSHGISSCFWTQVPAEPRWEAQKKRESAKPSKNSRILPIYINRPGEHMWGSFLRVWDQGGMNGNWTRLNLLIWATKQRFSNQCFRLKGWKRL